MGPAKERSPLPANPQGSPAAEKPTPSEAVAQQAAPPRPEVQETAEVEKLRKRLEDQQKETTRAQMEAAELKRRLANMPPEIAAAIDVTGEPAGLKAIRQAVGDRLESADPITQLEAAGRLADQRIELHNRLERELMYDYLSAMKKFEKAGKDIQVTPLLEETAKKIKIEMIQNPSVKGNAWVKAVKFLEDDDRDETVIAEARQQGEQAAIQRASAAAATRMESPGGAPASVVSHNPPPADVKMNMRDYLLHKISTAKDAKGRVLFPSMQQQ